MCIKIQCIALLEMGHSGDLKKNEHLHLANIWLLQTSKKKKKKRKPEEVVCATQMDLNSNVGTIPMEILF